jgi:hypothetical protein
MEALDYSQQVPHESPETLFQLSDTRSVERQREDVRGDLARGLLWLLTLAIGGVLAFVGLGRLDGTVITQSIFPSLIALAGTALGFYFGSQSGKASDSAAPGGKLGGNAPRAPATAPASPAGKGGGTIGAGAEPTVASGAAPGGAPKSA